MLKEDEIDPRSIQDFLSEIDIFTGLGETALADVAQHMKLRRYEPGEHLIWAGSVGEYLSVVKSGTIYVSLDNKDIELGSGAVVGEMALLSQKPSKADVVALSDADVYTVNFDDFHDLMERHAGLASAMSDLMKSRMFGDKGINRIGRYNVMGQFAGGGMPDMYYGLDPENGEDVVIKMLNYQMSSQANFKQSFRNDFHTVFSLNHPNILSVIETIDDYSTEFIIYEKMTGIDIANCVEQEGVFSAKMTGSIISKVAMALEYANQEDNGIFKHGDIEPCNIMVDEHCDVRLMGFGLANFNVTEESVPFRAPEVLKGEASDYRADIYSLGAVAYFMLCGKFPYQSTDVASLVSEQENSLPPDINSQVAGLPEGLAEFINRALVRNPEERISNWFEVLTLLVSGKGSTLNVLSNETMDTAFVIQLKSADVDSTRLQREVHELLSSHQAQYEMEVVTRGNRDVDFSR